VVIELGYELGFDPYEISRVIDAVMKTQGSKAPSPPRGIKKPWSKKYPIPKKGRGVTT
jgi:hypothetical protein